jgi:hypothetical protein
MWMVNTFPLCLCVQIFTYFLFHTPHHQLLPCSVQLVLMWCYNRWGWRAAEEIWRIIESVKIVPVYLSLQNNKIKVMVSFKCYDSFEKLPYWMCSEQRKHNECNCKWIWLLNFNILMLIWTDVFIYWNKVTNEGKRHLNSLYWSWIGNSCGGDTALCQNM